MITSKFNQLEMRQKSFKLEKDTANISLENENGTVYRCRDSEKKKPDIIG